MGIRTGCRYPSREPFQIAKITITKLDTVQGQLRTAIRLWFEGGNAVAVHTLAAAAHEIVHTLFKRDGLNGLLFDSRLLRPEGRKVFSEALKAPANFFKHAREDKDKTLTYDQEDAVLLMLACCTALSRMGHQRGVEEAGFAYWMLFTEPERFSEPQEFIDTLPIEILKRLPLDSPNLFFIEFERLRNEGIIYLSPSNS